MKNKTIPVDKNYKLKSRETPLAFMLPTKNSSRYPLMYFDEEQNVNRALRYARNQKSPFEDEQDGNAILEPIIFEDGFLHVPKNNPVLQSFLHYHPMNGKSFEEIDNERDAQEDVAILNLEVDALIEARQLSLEQIENVARVLFNVDPSKISTAELKRDILIFAKRDPREFLQVIKDPSLQLHGKIQLLFDKGLLTFRKNKKEVWYNTSSNKTRMLVVPFSSDAMDVTSSYLQSDEGIDSLIMLENLLEE
tara:strand:- start:438 stop:1187 length:750 start_codon:yes stop_codon:yes gene_type:complete